MFGHTLRSSGQTLARVALRQNAVTLRRTFVTPTAVRQADLVQDMYLKELKAYKPAPLKANDSDGQVQKFSIPKPPHSPEEADLQSELGEYEKQVPEVQGQAAEGTSKPVQDWFEEEVEEEEAAHH